MTFVLTQEMLKKAMRYSPIVGAFEKIVGDGRKGHPRRWVLAGGSRKIDGYIVVSVYGKQYRAHRLAWLYVYGEWPGGDIDHIDGDRTNNAIANLRLVTNFENMQNSAMHRNNTSGVKGVSWSKAQGKWVGRIRSGGKIIFNKYFNSIDEARAEIEAFRQGAQGEFANHGVHKYVLEDMT